MLTFLACFIFVTSNNAQPVFRRRAFPFYYHTQRDLLLLSSIACSLRIMSYYHGGVIQYDFGRTIEGGRFIRNGTLNEPPAVLLSAVSTLQARHKLHGHQLLQYLEAMDTSLLRSKYTYQGADNDVLFKAEYDHIG